MNLLLAALVSLLLLLLVKGKWLLADVPLASRAVVFVSGAVLLVGLGWYGKRRLAAGKGTTILAVAASLLVWNVNMVYPDFSGYGLIHMANGLPFPGEPIPVEASYFNGLCIDTCPFLRMTYYYQEQSNDTLFVKMFVDNFTKGLASEGWEINFVGINAGQDLKPCDDSCAIGFEKNGYSGFLQMGAGKPSGYTLQVPRPEGAIPVSLILSPPD